MASPRAETASLAAFAVRTIAVVLSVTVLVAGVVFAATPASASPYVYDADRGSDWLSTSVASSDGPEQRIPDDVGFAAHTTSGYDDSSNLARTNARQVGYRLAPNTAGRVAGLADDGVNVLPSSGRTFVGTPRGTIYDVPQGWAPRVADNGRGIVYQRPGAFRNADSIRIMEPTSKYPSGYVRYYNSGNQPLDVFGNPGADPFTHMPQDYVGPWPGWPL